MTFIRIVLPALRSVVILMECVILLRVVFEFFATKRDSLPVRFIIRISEPLLMPLRKLMNREARGGRIKLDLSPIVAMIILYVISRLLK